MRNKKLGSIYGDHKIKNKFLENIFKTNNKLKASVCNTHTHTILSNKKQIS